MTTITQRYAALENKFNTMVALRKENDARLNEFSNNLYLMRRMLIECERGTGVAADNIKNIAHSLLSK